MDGHDEAVIMFSDPSGQLLPEPQLGRQSLNKHIAHLAAATTYKA